MSELAGLVDFVGGKASANMGGLRSFINVTKGGGGGGEGGGGFGSGEYLDQIAASNWMILDQLSEINTNTGGSGVNTKDLLSDFITDKKEEGEEEVDGGDSDSLGGISAMSKMISGISKVAGKLKIGSYAISFITNTLSGFDSIGGSFNTLSTVLGTGFQPMINDINMAVLSLIPYMAQGAETIRNMYQALKDWLGSDLSMEEKTQQIKDWISDLPQKMVDWIADAIPALMDWFNDLPDDLLVKIVEGSVKMFKWFWKLPGEIIYFVINNADVIWNWFVGLPSKIVRWIGRNISTLGTYIGGVPGKMVTWLGEKITGLSTWFKELPGNFLTYITDNFLALKTWFTDLPGEFVAKLSAGISTITTWFSNLPQSILDAITGSSVDIVQGIKDWWADLWD